MGYPVKILIGSSQRILDMQLTKQNRLVKATGENIVFDLEPTASEYVSPNGYILSKVPIDSDLPLSPDSDYFLSGQVQLKGLESAILYVIEFSRSARLTTHRVTLDNGPFRLAIRTSNSAHSCRLTIRVTGKGRLALSPLEWSPGLPPTFHETIERLVNIREKKLIFVAGCARSGTTMFLNMMRCFRDTYCDLVERPVTFFSLLEDRPEKALVLKRTGDSISSLADIPEAVGVIYLVRNPFDVLTSTHPLAPGGFYVSGSRWRDEFFAYKRLLEFRKAPTGGKLLVLRYEDVVQAPEAEQAKVSRTWGLEPYESFSEFHRLAEGDEPSRYQAAMGRLRPPSVDAVEKWRTNPALREQLRKLVPEYGEDIAEFCHLFNYDDAPMAA